jgi:N-acetyl-anhydromuramyl-L-alanine amidase AmpD
MNNILLKKGSKGNAVKEIQLALGLNPDGIFGSFTEAAVKSFQKKYSLVEDGIVGPATYERIILLRTDLTTDRFGYNEENDTDDKLEKLGEYLTEDGLSIDKVYLDSDEYVRDYGKIEPLNLFIHHTAGWNNPYNTINSWNKDKRGRVATQYCIGGINIKNGEDKYDGKVVECFPDNYIGWHLGKVGNFNVSKYSVGIELNNFGFVTKKGDKFFNYVNIEVPKEMVVDLGYEFRGYRYWHKYTDKQIENLKLLIKHISKIYPTIDICSGLTAMIQNGTDPKEAFEFNQDAYDGKKNGLYTHTNVRKDKFDCYPDPRLVDMLKSL